MSLSLKKAVLATLSTGLLSLAAHTALAGVTLSPMVGQTLFDNDTNLENDQFLSLGLGYQFDSPWGVELTYFSANPDIEQSNGDLDYSHIRLDGLYHFMQDEPVQPYLAFGAGEQTYDVGTSDSKSTLVNVGAGLKALIKGGLSLRTDIRLLNDTDLELTSYAVGLGLNYEFGKQAAPTMPKATPAAAPVDSDGDGISDANDRCAGTPAGTAVDANGCAMSTDDDNDGIANSMDQCPGTKAGAKVDDKGCYIIITETKTVNLEVGFASNSAEVPSSAMGEIKEVADFLTQYPLTNVAIEGHTDDSGSAAYNKTLSQKRADAVAQVLITEFGVDSSRVSAMGYGEERPIVANDTALNRAKNRRVTATVSAKVESIQQ